MKNISVAPKTQMPTNGILAPDYPTCPFRNVITRFGDKWSLLILYVLHTSGAPIRFNELEKSIPDISSRVLSSCLRTFKPSPHGQLITSTTSLSTGQSTIRKTDDHLESLARLP